MQNTMLRILYNVGVTFIRSRYQRNYNRHNNLSITISFVWPNRRPDISDTKYLRSIFFKHKNA